jgi:NAD(P)-dependent dehydrogenase (short-subunit alcohol dehydrogenase family)
LGGSRRETFGNSWLGCRPTVWVNGRRSSAMPSWGPPWTTPCAITGRDQDRVRAAIEPLSQNGKACGITAELTDRDQVPEVGKPLAAEHADATLLVNAAGFFIPKAFSEYDEA